MLWFHLVLIEFGLILFDSVKLGLILCLFDRIWLDCDLCGSHVFLFHLVFIGFVLWNLVWGLSLYLFARIWFDCDICGFHLKIVSFSFDWIMIDFFWFYEIWFGLCGFWRKRLLLPLETKYFFKKKFNKKTIISGLKTWKILKIQKWTQKASRSLYSRVKSKCSISNFGNLRSISPTENCSKVSL